MINNQHFSFPRAQRFAQLHKSVDLPYYNLPSSLKKRSISIGQRTPLKIHSISPSPQHYNVGNTRSPMAKSFGIGRESMYQPNKSYTPGPNNYQIPSTLKKIAFSIRPKLQIKTEISSVLNRTRLKTIF